VSTYANPDNALKTLGWSAKHDLAAIVQTAYEWHLSQLDGSR
jgi:UDP-glucose 4-epimerase